MLENAKDSNILGYVHELISGMSFRSWKCNLQKKNNEYATVLYDSEKFIPGKENLTLKCLVST